MALNPDLVQWLSDNRDSYEFYVLHAIMHDPMRRASLMVPLIPDDFRLLEFSLVMQALENAVKVTTLTGDPMPCPPDVEWMRTYVESAGLAAGAEEDAVVGAMKIVENLQSPTFIDEYYLINPLFQLWYGGVRAKRAARRIQGADVPDVVLEVGEIQKALSAASTAAVTDEEDEMMQVIESEDMEIIPRRPTGITGLDACLNGGWGPNECYLMFSGSGGGKSIAAGQCALNEMLTGGYPLIVSTELTPKEYVARIVSAACSVSIDVIQDCANFAQIRSAVASSPKSQFRLKSVNKVLELIKNRLRVKKISADEGMASRVMLETEAMRYENQMGQKPTWMCLDWLGSVADLGAGAGNGGSERAMAWEMAANGCVQFADISGIPTLVLAQAVNNAQTLSSLAINDIGISKGIAKNMIAVIGITNTLDAKAIKLAAMGKADMPKHMTPEDQFFCLCKARKGEGNFIPVTRVFRYQKFEEKSKKAG